MTPQNLMLLPLSTPKLSIGCPILDDCLGGGIPCNSITELVGESGYRKTQLCLQLTARAQRSAPTLTWRTRGLLRLHIHKILLLISSIATTRQRLSCIIPQLNKYQTTPANLKRRSEMFFNISGTLKGLANKFGLAVVVTNQVVDFIGPHDGVNGVRLGNLESLDTSGRRVSLALGLAWAHCINSRVFLARREPSIGINIRNAPSAIRKEGIVGVSRKVKESVVEIAKAIDDEDGLIGALNAFHRHFPHSKSEDKPE
ncbi:hypothetical protein L3X38_008782 [Prunus dulcis]|uniref:RecA family profile 1 domain-containing protein n=1 Tax=Prunus dulcis TaxID=3755 RepID=A0AAD4ZX63_PRUDU|nr:hypothetical protein L3X38_008782 [Prunus dulcis]